MTDKERYVRERMETYRGLSEKEILILILELLIDIRKTLKGLDL